MKHAAPSTPATCRGGTAAATACSSAAVTAQFAGRHAEPADAMAHIDQKMEKLSSPSARACFTASALAGAVVSKPMAKNTTWRSGCSFARRTASSGE